MSTTQSRSEKRTGVRPTYFSLGIDGRGRHHTFRSCDDTVHVVVDGARVHVEDLSNSSIEHWMAFVGDISDGWATRDYAAGMTEIVERALR